MDQENAPAREMWTLRTLTGKPMTGVALCTNCMKDPAEQRISVGMARISLQGWNGGAFAVTKRTGVFCQACGWGAPDDTEEKL